MAQSDKESVRDVDPLETREWLESINSVLEREGPERAHFLLEALIDRARRTGAHIPFDPNTTYVNTIQPSQEEKSPGDHALEWRIRSLIRWNAMAMVVHGHRDPGGLGGHIATFASIATLYDVGFNHFFRAPSADHGGDLVYFQGHASEGIYARAYLEGRIDEEQLHNFRQELAGPGLSSYPHPWLMPDFWQFATVSVGLGPIQAIYQARFMKYLHNRGVANTEQRKVWAFLGDGETDEPESLGALDIAAREGLDNLIFVVNCNLQRLDGPVRGNAQIIQELEGRFRGAGWNVIKVIWGSHWDPLLATDYTGLLHQRMDETVDGLYQACKAHGGAYTREHFFGAYPELKSMVANLSDEDIGRLNRGGHDPHKIYAAYAQAVKHTGQPTVILAKTVKGYGMGEAGEGMNITHQQEEMGEQALRDFRARFNIPVSDENLTKVPFYRPPEDSEEIRYMRGRREALGGFLPTRRSRSTSLEVPGLEAFDRLLKGSGGREISTTMVFVRILQTLTKDQKIGDRVVPIVPDEARTFGMEGLFRSIGLYSARGQLYTPPDSEQLAWYRESTDGQILEEGITEAGSISSWIAAATAYSTHNKPMLPFFAYYSMFGYQRVGDLCWAAADMRARGFLMGGTSGRTTMNGEGLQHQDGHSHILYSVVPSARCYDPTFGYEMVVIVQDGMRRMLTEQEDVYYYLTMMNANYEHPPMPEGAREGIVRGMYLFDEGDNRYKHRVQLVGSGAILHQVIAARDLLKEDWQVSADVWSAPGITELRREGLDVDHWNALHPEDPPRKSWVTQQLEDRPGPVIAATDYIKAYADQIRAFVPAPYYVLGTDGYGRSDTRERLRDFFEVDARWIALTALRSLADQGGIERTTLTRAMRKYDIDPDKPNPATV